MSGLDELVPALFDLLNDAPGKPTGLTVHEHAGQNVSKPYLVIGEQTEVPQDRFRRASNTDTVTVHGFSDYLGSKEARSILRWLKSVVRGATLALPSGSAGALRVEFATISRDPDGVYHLVARVRARTHAT